MSIECASSDVMVIDIDVDEEDGRKKEERHREDTRGWDKKPNA
jgi:hypothetical protein